MLEMTGSKIAVLFLVTAGIQVNTPFMENFGIELSNSFGMVN